jgi:hypothetical protein
LFSQNAILLAQIVNDKQLMLVYPTSDGDQQKPEWIQDSRHLDSPLLRAPGDGWQSVQIQADPVFGPYAFEYFDLTGPWRQSSTLPGA